MTKACKIEMQSVSVGRHTVPSWWCTAHTMPVGPEDKQCALGKIEEATESGLARIALEVGRAASEKAETIRRALKL